MHSSTLIKATRPGFDQSVFFLGLFGRGEASSVPLKVSVHSAGWGFSPSVLNRLQWGLQTS
jgi:hypothetical protein